MFDNKFSIDYHKSMNITGKMSGIKRELNAYANKSKHYAKVFKIKCKQYHVLKYVIILFAIYILALMPLFRANYNYIDDLGRAFAGYRFDDFGRYGSNMLSIGLWASRYLTDISPFPQILAAFIMALAGTMLIFIIRRELPNDDRKFHVRDIVATIPLALFPYFLECLCFKYDAPFMALSVFISIFPLLFKNRKRRQYVVISALSMLLMCLTYQASSGVYPMLVLLIFAIMLLQKKKDVMKFLIWSVIPYVVTLLFYEVFMVPKYNTYVTNEMFSLNKLLPGVINNFRTYLKIIKINFSLVWLALIAAALILCIIGLVTSSKLRWHQSLTIAIVLPAVMFLLCFGVYPALTKPLFCPRGMLGFGIWITMIFITACACCRWYFVPGVVCLAASYSFFTFALSLGNILNNEQEYANFREYMIISDISQIEASSKQHNKVRKLKVSGSIGYAPSYRKYNSVKSAKIMTWMIPRVLKDDTFYWNVHHLANYYGLKNINYCSECSIFKDNKKNSVVINSANGKLSKKDEKVMKEVHKKYKVRNSMYNDVYYNDKEIFVVLKQ